MSRLAFDPAKAARWHIPIPFPIAPVSAGAFDFPRNCYGINRKWAALFIECADILRDKRTWDSASKEQLDWMEQQVGLIQSRLLREINCAELQDCPDCPGPIDCPDCPGPIEQPGVGASGMSYEELENYYMACVNIAAGLKVEDGILYAKDDCCVWQEIGNISTIAAAAVNTAPKGIGEIKSLSDSARALFLAGLPKLTAIPHPTESFNNDYTRKCLKATATKYILQTLIADMRDAADAADVSSWQEAMGLISTFLGVTPLKDLSILPRMASFLATWGASAVVAEFNAILADTESWDELVCTLAEAYTVAATFTGEDVSIFLENSVTFSAIFTEMILSLTDQMIPTEFQARVNENISAVTCECSDYLPSGYTPPLGTGEFKFTFERFFDPSNSVGGFINPADGEPLAGIDTPVGEYGIRVGNYFKTELRAQDSGNWWQFFGVVLSMSSEITLAAVRINVVFDGIEPETTAFWISPYEADTDEWKGFGGDFDSTSPIKTGYETAGLSNDHVTKVAIIFMASSDDAGAQATARAVSVRMDGSWADGSFTNLEMGDIATP